jgi:hypothetical protein
MSGGATAKATPGDDLQSRLKVDKRILTLFGVFATVSILIPLLAYSFAKDATGASVASAMLGGLGASFLVAGIPSILTYRRHGLTPRRKILIWMCVLSLVTTVAMVVGIAVASQYVADSVEFPEMSIAEVLFMGGAIVITLFLAFYVMFFLALVIAFGAVGVLSAAERRITPWILRRVVELGSSQRPSLLDRGVRWLFDIPDVLDTKTLNINPMPGRTWVGRSDLKIPVAWQVFFGVILAVYISFNPFISDRSPAALLGIFSLLTSAAVFIPVIILPWFIFKRLGAEIRGQTKQFMLYNGIRARVFQSYLAVGTIFILVRLSFSEIAVAIQTYLIGFFAFALVLLGASLLCTFVYVNYFENHLVDDIVLQFKS